jgi:hypothetical protein
LEEENEDLKMKMKEYGACVPEEQPIGDVRHYGIC